jgi:site-specific recombinase XerD
VIRQLAGFSETVIPYSLRHSSIVRALRNGIPAEMVGKLHDTSPAMISSNYAAFIVSALDEVARLAVMGWAECGCLASSTGFWRF